MTTDASLPSAENTDDYFTGLTGDYAAYRPGYPQAVIDAALAGLWPPAPGNGPGRGGRFAGTPIHRPTVADIGCGTGICTRMLATAGADVIGIDPNEDMLSEAARTPPAPGSSSGSPGMTEMKLPDDGNEQEQMQGSTGARIPGAGAIEYRRATAEDAGLEDNSVDLVLCAQAFHWFHADEALREFHRILLTGARLALLWNVRQKTDPFTGGYEEIARRAQADTQERGRLVRRSRGFQPDRTNLFTNVRVLRFDNPQILNLASLIGRARSSSYYPRIEPVRSELDEALKRLFDEHERDGLVTLQHTTELTLCDAVETGARL